AGKRQTGGGPGGGLAGGLVPAPGIPGTAGRRHGGPHCHRLPPRFGWLTPGEFANGSRTMSWSLSPAPPVIKPNPLLKWVRTHFLERALWRLPRTDKVLDLCCGYGFYFSINPRAVGVDGDAASVQFLRAKGYDVRQCNVLETLPFGPNEFEYVVAHDVLEHF